MANETSSLLTTNSETITSYNGCIEDREVSKPKSSTKSYIALVSSTLLHTATTTDD